MVLRHAVIILLIVTNCSLSGIFAKEESAKKNSLEKTAECKQACLPKELYLKAHSYMSKSKVYGNFTLEQTIEHFDALENWKEPKELIAKFPYYLAGYDYDDQPVWVGEVGKYNVREQIEKGPEAAENLRQYLFQAVFRMMKSMLVKDTEGKEIRQFILIGDWAGLDITQVAHVPTVYFCVDLIRTYLDFLLQMIAKSIGINVSYPAEVAFQLVRPYLGGVFERIELYGTNRAKWVAALRKLLPEDAIPTWYGGNDHFKPLQVFG